MNRRDLFGFLPGAALAAIPGVAAVATPGQVAEPSPWVELTCQREAIRDWVRTGPNSFAPTGEVLYPACSQKFKVLRVAVTHYCPKCGSAQDLSRPGMRALFSNPEVK